MKVLALLTCVWVAVSLTHGAPPTCYSRALGLGKETMVLLDRIHRFPRTKPCAQVLPTIFIDVHNACITTKLRDFLYVLLNHPDPECRQRPRLVLLKRKVQNLYTIITRLCYRDLVFFTDDCEGIDTGHSKPYIREDTLQLLQED
ncbi:cytokine-like protein 1 [Periophthalmus magnuspinnatus]|uniref:cytokine-like protein 1 n=1 Tax=Periophthalmus magnuspinnatus TaxID=409849 RepID=UPI00145A8630|nr:cytokine-like protein 1 [Periophthalmus magnuspinnatus]